jgi:predicted RNase H-like nuclease (RuvC/YqgF family)
MKKNLKEIVIGALILGIAFLLFRNHSSNSEVSVLDYRNKELDIQIGENNEKIKELEIEVEDLLNGINEKESSVILYDEQIAKMDGLILDLKDDLRDSKERNKNLNRNIQYLKDNPLERTGEDLIYSLKQKINKIKYD